MLGGQSRITGPVPGQAVMPADLAVQVTQALPLLQYLADDIRRLADIDEALRIKLVSLAGALSRPDRYTRRALGKAISRQKASKEKQDDREVLATTGIRALRKDAVFKTPLPMPSPALQAAMLEAPALDVANSGVDPWAQAEAERAAAPRQVHAAKICYVCKQAYRQLHWFYDQMCSECADFNWTKRNQTADLQNRVVLITGARVKIGYQAAMKLLRADATTVVVTRFPSDAAARFAAETDSDVWQHRLHIYGCDLRHTPSVEALCQHLLATLPRLDGIINNACQTVRRPAGFYNHLLQAESQTQRLNSPALQRYIGWTNDRNRLALGSSHQPASGGEIGFHDPVALSQVPLLPQDLDRGNHLFPAGQLDADLQQVDLRDFNSWRMRLTDVPTTELVEVQLVNAIAPFVINARLKPLMSVVASQDTHIVNVSAMEGQFYRRWKTDKHPHTNMAKAALNMMTRTSASDYRRDGIHMNSVDTGWVSDEDPSQLAARKLDVHNFHPPLDIVDGAARIVDPLFDGLNSGRHQWGIFIKDYKPAPW
jgi:NAD(P)-dependent dehydrogenase (short-subunit alcohol dehydrogenase family)